MMRVTARALAGLAALLGAGAAQSGEFKAARLGDDLTPMGAERAGDTDLGIPAWDGGLGAGAPAPVHYLDPYAADVPLGTVSAADGGRWSAWLTAGMQARLLADPDLRLPVYPSHRSAAGDDAFYAATRENALHASLRDGLPDQVGPGVPFPVPDTGLEVVWNHLLRQRSPSGERTLLQAIVQPDGRVLSEHLVQRFVPQYTHIPEAQSVAVPAQDRDFDGTWTAKRRESDPPLRPLRMLEKPEEIHGVLATVPDGLPPRFRWRKAWFNVVRAEGPERIAMDWWRKENPTRDYYRVETENGQRFWLYRDGLFRDLGLATRWYLQGIFA